jgi:hypothetical protein
MRLLPKLCFTLESELIRLHHTNAILILTFCHGISDMHLKAFRKARDSKPTCSFELTISNPAVEANALAEMDGWINP